ADVVLVDVGPSLGALNRAALVAADHVVVPLAPDLFSVQGLRNLGPALRTWRTGWHQRLDQNPDPDLPLPEGTMRVGGYVLQQHGIRQGKPTRAFQRWMDRVTAVYRTSVLGESGESAPAIEDDEHCLAQIKNYASLMPMAQDARKPVFALTAADGAFGGHQQAAQRAFGDFRTLTMRVLDAVGVRVD
ncbi:MAG TPA: ParA family protein, partial [Pseudonocardiaceae bacterium]